MKPDMKKEIEGTDAFDLSNINTVLVRENHLLRQQIFGTSHPHHQSYRRNKSRITTDISFTLAVDGKRNYSLSFHALAPPFLAPTLTCYTA